MNAQINRSTPALSASRWLLAAALLVLPLAGCGDKTEEASDGPGPVLMQVAEDPTVAFSVWFKVGSQNDPAGKEGLAQLTATMLAEGATTANSYEQILEKLYPIASGYGVTVDREMTTLRGRTHRDNLDKFFTLYTDAYLRPAFKETDFERLRSNQLNELEKTLRYASDEELGKAALFAAVYQGTPYAHPPLGTVQGLKAITLADVESFYQQHYTEDNAVVALAGGFANSLVDRFEATLEELPGGDDEGEEGDSAEDADEAAEAAAAQPVAVTPAPITGREVVLVDKPGADASISLGFPITVRRGEDDFYALWLANSWLGEHRNASSHLYHVIRETRGMNYGDYSYIEAFPFGGFLQMPPTNVARNHQIFEIWIRTLPNERAHFALRAGIRELEKLVDEGMTPEEFELTRSFLSKYALHFAPTNQDRLGYAIDDRFYGIEGEGHLARFRQRMSELTLDEVNAAIKKYLQYDNLEIAIVTGDAAAMKEALVADAASPIDYGPSQKPQEILDEDKIISNYPLKIAADKVTIVPVDEFLEK
jgi:zinc protease